MRIKVVFLSSVWPEPGSSAAGTRVIDLVRTGFHDGWDMCFAATAQMNEHSADLSPYGVRTQSIQLNDASFDAFIASEKPDIVFFDRFMIEEQFAMRVAEQCPNALRVLDTSDLHFLRRSRMQALTQQAELNLHTDDLLRELAAMYRSDLTLIISDFEHELLQQQFSVPADLLHYCPFMIESESWQESALGFHQRADFVMVGNFLHKPNADAVAWMAQEIWPLIKARLPDARCDVYGAYAQNKDYQLSRPKLDFTVHGRVEDLRDCLSRYRVNLATLRYGAGIKGKIADGFCAGTPCVTTSVGAEGMAGELAWGGIIADSVPGIVDAALRLYQDQSVWQSAQKSAYDIIRQRFLAAKHQMALSKRLRLMLANLTTHRQNNIVGAMLTHHSMKSTYYMSKWIEEKNKS